jgi:hypothetical protein
MDSPRPIGSERYSPVSIEAMLRLQDGPARSFLIASAIGSFRDRDGRSDRLRSGRDAAGSLVTPKRLEQVLEALGITDRHWRRLTADWERRYIAHRCGLGRVFLFTKPLLSPCPACGTDIFVTAPSPSPRTSRGSAREPNGRWRSASADRGGPRTGRNRSAQMDGTGPSSRTDAPHQPDGSLLGDEVGLGVGVAVQGSSDSSLQTRRERESSTPGGDE